MTNHVSSLPLPATKHDTRITHSHAQDLAHAYAPAAAQFSLPVAFTIREIIQDNYRTRTLVLDGEMDAKPGQFVMAWLPRFDEKPFSLVAAAPITLMITAVGPFSRLAHTLGVGDKLWLRGPFGRGFTAPARVDARSVALVAGGYGVAPLYWLARTLIQANGDPGTVAPAITAIVGARGQADLLYHDRFARLFAGAEIRHNLMITTDDGSQGVVGRVTDALAPLLAAREVTNVFACGPDPMLAAVGALCTAHGVPGQLSWEAYMRCGVGLCGSCEHGGRLLCLDGPVLDH